MDVRVVYILVAWVIGIVVLLYLLRWVLGIDKMIKTQRQQAKNQQVIIELLAAMAEKQGVDENQIKAIKNWGGE